MEGTDPAAAKIALAERIVSAGYVLPGLEGLSADALLSIKTHTRKREQFRAGVVRALNGDMELLDTLTTEDLTLAAADAAPLATYMTPEQGGAFYVDELVRLALIKISSISG